MNGPAYEPVDPIERSLRSAGRFARAVLRTWQGWLTETDRDGVAMSHAWHEQWHALRTYIRDPQALWRAQDGPGLAAVAAFGARAFAFGLLVTVAVELATLQPLRSGVGTAFTEIIWAFGRYALLALVLPTRVIRRPRLLAAYLAGLTPYMFGVAAAPRLVSLVLSAWLTYRSIEGAGATRGQARVAVGCAFGGQLAVTLVLALGAGAALLIGM